MCFIIFMSILAIVSSEIHPLSDEFIESINNAQNSWTAGRNFHPNTPMSQIKSYLGSRKSPPNTYLPRLIRSKLPNLPRNFDSRTKWPNCTTIGRVRDQGSCGSCWAMAAVETMTDRICIVSGGKKKVELSTRNLLSCCNTRYGCEGGYTYQAWKYWISNGIVSGGSYNSSTGCQSYPFPRCDHVATGKYPACTGTQETPSCEKECDKDSKLTYQNDLHFGKTVYSLNADEDAGMSEIFENGPIEADFDVHEDFLSYKKGVYHHVKGKFLGGHAIKIIGWGVEKKKPYWLVVNSWNEEWGDKGLFKIRLGYNECYIEDNFVAGLPLL